MFERSHHKDFGTCSEQIWLLEPESLKNDRIDAFAYAPELLSLRKKLLQLEKDGFVKNYHSKDFILKKKLTKKEKKEMSDSGVAFKYIEISDVTKHGLIVTSVHAQFKSLPTRAEFIINEGDVLFAINNSSRGTVVIVPKEFDGALCTSGFYVIKPRSKKEGLLLWYSLRSEYARKQIYYLSQTASQPELKIKTWNEIFFITIPTGDLEKKAVQEAEAFQDHLSALLNDDKITFAL